MPPTIRDWLVPGVVIALLSSILSIGGSYAVNNYRLDKAEVNVQELKGLIIDSQRSMNQRIEKLDDRLDDQIKGSSELVRLQEQNRSLDARIADLRAELKEVSAVANARYDNLSTRLARQGF